MKKNEISTVLTDLGLHRETITFFWVDEDFNGNDHFSVVLVSPTTSLGETSPILRSRVHALDVARMDGEWRVSLDTALPESPLESEHASLSDWGQNTAVIRQLFTDPEDPNQFAGIFEDNNQYFMFSSDMHTLEVTLLDNWKGVKHE